MNPALALPTGADPSDVSSLRRFMKKTRLDADTGCLVWIGSKQTAGYGIFGNGGKVGWLKDGTRGRGRLVLAHRWIWEREWGPIAPGLTIDHRCRNKACVNVAHLEPVTVKENNQRAWAARRAATCPHGHPLSGDNIRLRRGRRECLECVRRIQRAAYAKKHPVAQRRRKEAA